MTALSSMTPRTTFTRLGLGVDGWLLGSVVILLLIGLVTVASASISAADRTLGEPFYYLQRQALFSMVAAALGLAVYQLPLQLWERAGSLLAIAALVLLALVLVPGVGREVNGSTRWIDLGPLTLQASEPARLFFVIYIAGYMVRRERELRTSFRGFIKPLLLASAAAGLVLLEPDFGAASVLMATTVAMLFLGGVRIRDFLLVSGGVVVAMGGLAVSAPYRVERLTAFLNPWADPFDSGFQLTQSLIAIGRGELTGVGLGGSIQKLFYLPEAHTDFVFAVLAEETGMVGAILVIGLYAVFVWRCFHVAARAEAGRMRFGAHLCRGIGVWVGLQAFINIGVNMGVLPTKGLTLPLISYGNNSLMVTALACALVLRVSHEVAMSGTAAIPTKRGGRS